MKQGSKTTKQVRVEVELRKKSPSDVVVDTQETSKTVAQELAVEQVTLEPVLRRSSNTIRVLCTFITHETSETIADEGN